MKNSLGLIIGALVVVLIIVGIIAAGNNGKRADVEAEYAAPVTENNSGAVSGATDQNDDSLLDADGDAEFDLENLEK